jgi:hypothetical protein
MKGLFARAGVAILAGGSLVALAVQSAPQGVTASGRTPSAAVVREAHAAFIKYMSAHAPAVMRGKWVSPGLRRASVARTANGSVTGVAAANWSGYADAESSITQTVSYVSGSWWVPAVTCPSSPYRYTDAFIGQWIGIDGVEDPTVEQLGTAAECFEGVTFYYAWYQMYPNGTVEEGTAACINHDVGCPQPGDRISASISVKPGTDGNDNYTLSLRDYTTPGNSFSVTQSCSEFTCEDSSAEWIIERPSTLTPFGLQILPLVDFGRTSFWRADVTSGGRYSSIAGFKGGPVYDLAMTDDSDSYYLDCIGQATPLPTLLQTARASACPTVAPLYGGRFFATWDAGF